MIHLTEVILILVVFYGSITTRATDTEVLTTEWAYNPTEDVVIDNFAVIKNNIFPIARCTSGIDKNCTVTLESFSIDDVESKSKNVCQIHFYKEKDSEIDHFFRLLSAQGKNVIFSFLDNISDLSAIQVYRIVDMTTCEFHDAKIYFNMTNNSNNQGLREYIFDNTFNVPQVFQYEDGTFDVFVINKDMCTGGRCKVTYNAKGEMIGAPVSYLPTNMAMYDAYMYPLTRSRSPNRFFALVHNVHQAFHNLYSREQYKSLMEYKFIYADGNGETRDIISIKDKGILIGIDDSNEKLGFCNQPGEDASKIHCRQYDSSSDEKMKVALSLEKGENVVNIHNVAEGGFLLLTRHCDTYPECRKNNVYRLVRVEENGHLGKSTEVKYSICNERSRFPESHIISEKGDSLCIYKSCGDKKIKFAVKCFCKKDVY